MASTVGELGNLGAEQAPFFDTYLIGGYGFDELAFDERIREVASYDSGPNPEQATAKFIVIEHSLVVFPESLDHSEAYEQIDEIVGPDESSKRFAGLLLCAGYIGYNQDSGQPQHVAYQARTFLRPGERALIGHSQSLNDRLSPWHSDAYKVSVLRSSLGDHFKIN